MRGEGRERGGEERRKKIPDMTGTPIPSKETRIA